MIKAKVIIKMLDHENMPPDRRVILILFPAFEIWRITYIIDHIGGHFGSHVEYIPIFVYIMMVQIHLMTY